MAAFGGAMKLGSWEAGKVRNGFACWFSMSGRKIGRSCLAGFGADTQPCLWPFVGG